MATELSDNKTTARTPQLARSAILVSGLSFTVSAVSFINQLIIAKLFGASSHTDAYFVSTNAPLMVSGIIAGLTSYSVVPTLLRYKEEAHCYKSFSGLLLIGFIALAVLLSAVTMIWAPFLIVLMAPGMDKTLRPEAVEIARVAWLNVGLSVIVNFLAAAQNASKRFVMPVLANMPPFAGAIVFSALWGKESGMITLVIGMCAGYIISIPLLYKGLAGSMAVNSISREVVRGVAGVFAGMPLVLLSMLCFTIYGTVDAFWASALGPARLSFLGYGQRLIIAAGNLVVLGPATVLLPALAETANSGSTQRFRAECWRALRMVTAYAAPVAVIVAVLALPAIEVLFERGAFDHATALGVQSVLPGMLCGMVGMVGTVILFKALYAKNDIRMASVLGAAGALLYFVLSGVLSRRIGVNGIVLAYGLSWWLLLAVSVARLWRGHHRELRSRENLAFICKLVLALCACGTICALLTSAFVRPLAEAGRLELTIQISCIAFAALSGYFALAWGVFRMSELALVVNIFRSLRLISPAPLGAGRLTETGPT